MPKTLSEFLRENIDTQFVTQLFKEENMLNAIKETVPRLWSLLVRISQSAVQHSCLLHFLYIVFILLDYESIAEGWLHLLPNKYRPFVVSVMNDVKDGMNRYFRGQAFVALCVGILFSIGFLIIDFPLAIAFGLVHRCIEHGALFADYRLYTYHRCWPILKAADTGQNFWIIIACAFAVFAIVQAIQDLHRTACHGENYRTEPCHHPIVFIDLGFIDGDAGYDYSTYRLPPLCSPTINVSS